MPGGRRDDLFDDWALQGCRRTEFEGKPCPLLGRVTLLRRLGQGGMGVVYYGSRLGVPVAVKVLPRAMQGDDRGVVRRFVQEAQIAGKLEAPHIVRVLDVGVDKPSGAYYIVMEYVRGMSAHEWVARRFRDGGRSEERDALDICIAATKGLAAAHVAGVLHRDVKPANILLPYDAEGEPRLRQARLADLGLARVERRDKTLTTTQVGMGTPGYYPPEQARDIHAAQKPADVFAMGATLYALLTGSAPFQGTSPVDIVMNTMRGKHVPVRRRRPDVSAPTAALLERCLKPDPLERFPDAPALLAALERCRDALDRGDDSDAVAAVGRLAGRAERGRNAARPRQARNVPYAPVAVVTVAAAVVIVLVLVLRKPPGLLVDSLPSGAVVSIDGEVKGRTPLFLEELSGSHDVHVHLKDHEGFRQQVDLADGERKELRPVLRRITAASLVVTSVPEGARVLVDGENRGRTNMVVEELRLGRHRVEVSAPFHEPRASDVDVEAGGSRAHFDLHRAMARFNAWRGAPGARLRLTRKPDGKSYEFTLDPKGAIPPQEIEAGMYTLKATADGWQEVEKEMTLDPKSVRSIALSMRALAGRLQIDSNPTGARVLIDGEPSGTTPFEGPVPVGRRVVELVLAQHAGFRKEITFAGGKPVDLGAVELAPWSTLDRSQLPKDATVRIGGAAIADGAPIQPGKVELEVRRPGFAPQTVTVQAIPGKPLVVRTEPWERFQARLDLRGLPEDARATIDGEPAKGMVTHPAAGTLKLRVERPGFREVLVDVPVVLGETRTPPEIEWVETKTLLDLSDFPSGTAFHARGMSPRRHGDTMPPGKHEGFLRVPGKRGRRVAFDVVSQPHVWPGLDRIEEEHVRRALAWLQANQAADGRWNCSAHGGGKNYDIGVTGLAILCFLEAGETPDHAVVKRGLAYLRKVQAQDGCFAGERKGGFIYNHACATLATLRAYRFSGKPELRESAQRALEYVKKAQNPYFGWRYQPRSGKNDTSVTGWMLRVLVEARGVGFDVPDDTLTGGILWIEKMTDPEHGRVGYNAPGGQSARPKALTKTFPAELTCAMTAVGTLCRLLVSGDPKNPLVLKGAEFCKELPPTGKNSARFDFYAWYHGAELFYRLGGKPWQEWRAALLEAFEPLQHSAGRLAGSWDPVSVWSSDGGRIYTTAIATLCLIRCYRAPR